MGSNKKNALNLSAEVGTKEDGEKGHKEKLIRYAKAKTHQLGVLDYILQHEPNLSREADSMEGCSRTLIFRHWHTVSKYRLIGGCTCKKHLLCAMCALRRSAKTVKEVEKKIKSVLLENPSLVPVLMTMTIRNGHDLAERYEHISCGKKKLLQLRRNALKSKKIRLKNTSVMGLVHGSVGSYEFKKGEGDHGWHPHSHEIALLDPSVQFQNVTKKGIEVSCPVDFEIALSNEWRKITVDSYVVDVRKITEAEGQTKEESLLKAICEASKYALKLNDIEVEDQVHAYKILCGRRLTFSYGSLWGIKVPENLNDDIEAELELLPYVDLVYSFYSGSFNLTEVTDTKDTLVSSKATKKRDEEKKKKIKSRFTRFSDKVEEYVEAKDQPLILRTDGVGSFSDKTKRREARKNIKVNTKIIDDGCLLDFQTGEIIYDEYQR